MSKNIITTLIIVILGLILTTAAEIFHRGISSELPNDLDKALVEVNPNLKLDQLLENK